MLFLSNEGSWGPLSPTAMSGGMAPLVSPSAAFASSLCVLAAAPPYTARQPGLSTCLPVALNPQSLTVAITVVVANSQSG